MTSADVELFINLLSDEFTHSTSDWPFIIVSSIKPHSKMNHGSMTFRPIAWLVTMMFKIYFDNAQT